MGKKTRFYADVQSLQDSVTGSNSLVTVSYPDGTKETFLVDFGMYQGLAEQEEKNRTIGFKPEKLVAIILTHAHVDHCGRIPMLYKYGATCRTFMTNDTLKVSEKLLRNTESIIASSQDPIYGNADLERALKKFRACDYESDVYTKSTYSRCISCLCRHFLSGRGGYNHPVYRRL